MNDTAYLIVSFDKLGHPKELAVRNTNCLATPDVTAIISQVSHVSYTRAVAGVLASIGYHPHMRGVIRRWAEDGVAVSDELRSAVGL